MSKLSKLDEAIEQLAKAEESILEARQAFNGEPEFKTLTDRANEVSDIQHYVSELFRRVESAVIEAAGLEPQKR